MMKNDQRKRRPAIEVWLRIVLVAPPADVDFGIPALDNLMDFWRPKG